MVSVRSSCLHLSSSPYLLTRLRHFVVPSYNSVLSRRSQTSDVLLLLFDQPLLFRVHPKRTPSTFVRLFSLLSANFTIRPSTDVPREETVSALYKKLKKRRWIHGTVNSSPASFELTFFPVRGTPGSGKSVLAELLRRHINEHEPETKVVLINSWPECQAVPTIDNTILILDEAQTTYGDKDFWSRFKNPGLEDVRVVAFASHGSSGYTGPDNVTPMWIGKEQRVGLARLDCGDGTLVGLLFSREEFTELVQLRFRDRGFSDTFLDCV